jgi:hypothetical protein
VSFDATAAPPQKYKSCGCTRDLGGLLYSTVAPLATLSQVVRLMQHDLEKNEARFQSDSHTVTDRSIPFLEHFNVQTKSP